MKKINLTIPEPCHEDWAQMTPEAQGRFCASCQKTVVDCTTMSDAQLVRLFSRPGRSVCGRLNPDQLNRPLAVPKKQAPWARYFFQFTIPAFLFSLKAGAQKKETPMETTIQPARLLGKVAYVREHAIGQTISGRVMTQHGKPIADASVIAGDIDCVTDSAGRFRFNYPGDTSVKVRVVALGYREQDVVMHGSENNITLNGLVIARKVEFSGMMGGLVIVREEPRAKKVPLMKPLKDTSAARYKVFPNPATAGSLVVVSFPTTADMPESVALYTANGRLVQHTPITGTEPALVFNLRLPENLSPGTYVLQLKTRNKKGNAAIKLMVE